MSFIVDFHLHSRFSRSCSKKLTLPNNAAWAQIKGIDLLTTADFTFPDWFKEIHEQLEESADGIYKLKNKYADQAEILVPESCKRPVNFMLTTEISLIYKKNDKCRKVHHVILAPNIETAAKINHELDKRGNIKSDGRPILGMDSKDLLRMLLDISEDIQLIPAHIWTPHFSILGSKSGFDTIEECFEELSDHICALETGLSSDPAMNWRLSQLDKYVLISSSDAHSPQKFGREATIMDCKMTYPSILNTLRNDHKKVLGTIEFFPEEGKYHADGLRNEELCLEPHETKKYNYRSPRTHKKITVGVSHRVEDLADNPLGRKPKTAREVWHIIPLAEIISEILDVGVQSKRVNNLYFEIINALGSEFFILKDCPLEDIKKLHPQVAEAIKRMRQKNIIVKPGYDGEFGVIKCFNEKELAVSEKQTSLF
ncbi:endonuclease Q family protein [Patescibacteria group bacterium]